MTELNLLKTLCMAPGVPGFESAVTDIVSAHLVDIPNHQYDGLGSLCVEVTPNNTTSKSKRILVEAHADEVGFMVSEITSNGYLKLQALGGWVVSSLQGSAFRVYTKNGDIIPGTIGCIPAHFSKMAGSKQSMPTVDDMILDVGAKTSEGIANLGICLGDMVCAYSDFVFNEKTNTCISKAFDNRVGCGIVAEVLHHFHKTKLNNTLLGGISVQEEIGTRGAQTLANLSKPDIALVLEGCPADDYPGLCQSPQTALGKGAHVRLFDPSHIADPSLVSLVLDIAKAQSIDVQPTVRKVGGTDAQKIRAYGNGVPTIVLGVPVRYAHGPMSMINLNDYKSCLCLIKALILALEN